MNEHPDLSGSAEFATRPSGGGVPVTPGMTYRIIAGPSPDQPTMCRTCWCIVTVRYWDRHTMWHVRHGDEPQGYEAV